MPEDFEAHIPSVKSVDTTKYDLTEADSALLAKMLSKSTATAKADSKKYAFSRPLANRIGILAALILVYLADRVQASKNVRNAKHWFYISTSKLAKLYPFVGRTSVHSAVRKLIKEGLIEVGNYNRKKYDRTVWYHVTAFNRDLASREPAFFDPAEATRLGLVPAILLSHFRYLETNCPEHFIEGWLTVSPKDWLEYQPFLSVDRIRSGFSALVKAKVLIRHWDGINSGESAKYARISA